MGRLKSLKEAVFGTPEPTEVKEGKIIIGKYKQDYGVRPSSTFKSQVEVFKKDSIVREAIIHTAMEVVGAGFFSSIADDYTVVLPKPEGNVNWTAKEAIDFFNEQNNMDEILLTVAIELVAYGNSFLYIKNGLKHIDLEAISKAIKRSKTIPVESEYDLELIGSWTRKVIKWGEFIHFRANVTSSSAPFGTGIIAGLIESYDSTVPTLLEVRNTIRKSMKTGFEKHSFANELWSFPELSDEQIEAEDGIGKKIANMESTGQRIATNVKGSIDIALPERSPSYDVWLKQQFDEFVMSLGNPSLKASVESGFTEASIKGSIELFEKKIATFKRIIKRLVEAMWKKCLEEYGFDPIKAKPRLNFGPEETPEYETDDVLSAFDKKIISREEARTMLKEGSKWKLTDEEKDDKEVESDEKTE